MGTDFTIGLLALSNPSIVEISAIAGNLGLLLLPVAAFAWLVVFRRRRAMADELTKAAAAANARRDAFHFEQGQIFNQTGLKKMQLESKLLDLQVQIAERELANRIKGEQINSVAIEKLKLEVESMKLHIREQHKRLDDFGNGFE